MVTYYERQQPRSHCQTNHILSLTITNSWLIFLGSSASCYHWCGLWTHSQSRSVLQRFLDPWTDSRSLFPEKLQMWFDVLDLTSAHQAVLVTIILCICPSALLLLHHNVCLVEILQLQSLEIFCVALRSASEPEAGKWPKMVMCLLVQVKNCEDLFQAKPVLHPDAPRTSKSGDLHCVSVRVSVQCTC